MLSAHRPWVEVLKVQLQDCVQRTDNNKGLTVAHKCASFKCVSERALLSSQATISSQRLATAVKLLSVIAVIRLQPCHGIVQDGKRVLAVTDVAVKAAKNAGCPVSRHHIVNKVLNKYKASRRKIREKAEAGTPNQSGRRLSGLGW